MSQDGGQDLTLMFADIPTALSVAGEKAASLSREEVEHCLSLLGGIQERCGGKFTREVGNALVCCFDAPEEGVRAACEMQQMASAEGSGGAPGPGLRIALHAGKPIMRNGVCTGEVMTTAARLVTMARPGQIITTDRVTAGLDPKADVQVTEVPNASSMEKRLHVRLFQICWGGQTLTAAAPKTATKRRERQNMLGADQKEGPLSHSGDSGDDDPQGDVAAFPSKESSAIDIDFDPDATEILDLLAITTEDGPVQRAPEGGDGLLTVEAQRAMAAAVSGEGSSSEETTLCLIWRGQILSIRNEDDVIHLGREDENEVVLDSDTASRLHAHIERRGATFVLVDYSSNGTFVYDSKGNQKRVRDGEGSSMRPAPCRQDVLRTQ